MSRVARRLRLARPATPPEAGRDRLEGRGASRASGSRLRRRTMRLLLVAVALDYADRAMLGGVAPSVRADFHVSNTQLGLAAAIFSLGGGIATLPAGVP